MIRARSVGRISHILGFVLVGLLLPVSARAQDPDTRTPSMASSEASVFLNSLELIRENHMGEFSDSVLWSLALDGLIDRLGDPYAEVYTPSEFDVFQEETSGNYAGIGVQITQLNNAVTVTAVFRQTPAELVGLMVGDEIVGVDGESAVGWTTEQVSDRIRGEVGSRVDVEIKRDGLTRPLLRTIQRDSVHVSAVTSDRLDDMVGYLSLERVARGSAEELDAALQELSTTRGVIIDLRRNPGGYLDESLFMTDLFLPPGEILARTRMRETPGGPAGGEEAYAARIPNRVADKPIIVLVDPFTASAAEILAGGLQDHDRALVIGEPTFGKGVIQQIYQLPYNHRLRFTVGSWHTPLGRSLNKVRDENGRVIEAEDEPVKTVTTAGGRTLIDGGGVLPDLEIQADTLLASEQDFLREMAESGVLFELRLQEFGFAQALVLRSEGVRPTLREAAYTEFLDQLRAEGVSADLLSNTEVNAYIRWRARLTVADRMDDLAAALEIRMERDPVLTEAVRLLRAAESQSELFRIAG